MNRLGTFVMGMVVMLMFIEAGAGLYWHNEVNFVSPIPTGLLGSLVTVVADFIGEVWK